MKNCSTSLLEKSLLFLLQPCDMLCLQDPLFNDALLFSTWTALVSSFEQVSGFWCCVLLVMLKGAYAQLDLYKYVRTYSTYMSTNYSCVRTLVTYQYPLRSSPVPLLHTYFLVLNTRRIENPQIVERLEAPLRAHFSSNR